MAITAEGQRDRMIITDNSVERIEVYWDKDRFGLMRWDKTRQDEARQVIILNRHEAFVVAEFIQEGL